VRVRRHLTVANVVAVIALILALGTGAYAAGLGRSSVKSKQIKDGAVTGKELKPEAVNGDKVANGSLTGADFADDSLNGDDIDEATLQGVNAVGADTVGGLALKKVNFQAAQNTGPTTVLVYPNVFRIDAQCVSFGDGLDITAFTAVDDSVISMASWFGSSGNEEDALRSINSQRDLDFDSAESFQIDNNLANNVGDHDLTIQFVTPGGFVMTAQLRTEEVGAGCKITGTAFGG